MCKLFFSQRINQGFCKNKTVSPYFSRSFVGRSRKKAKTSRHFYRGSPEKMIQFYWDLHDFCFFRQFFFVGEKNLGDSEKIVANLYQDVPLELSKWLVKMGYNPQQKPHLEVGYSYNPLIYSPLILTSCPQHLPESVPQERTFNYQYTTCALDWLNGT